MIAFLRKQESVWFCINFAFICVGIGVLYSQFMLPNNMKIGLEKKLNNIINKQIEDSKTIDDLKIRINLIKTREKNE